jgi:hypothetical protein
MWQNMLGTGGAPPSFHIMLKHNRRAGGGLADKQAKMS